MPAPIHIREASKKLARLGWLATHDRASRWKVSDKSGAAASFYIEVTHGRKTERDMVVPRYQRSIQRKLGISRQEWEDA
jgi:hypothetical protein